MGCSNITGDIVEAVDIKAKQLAKVGIDVLCVAGGIVGAAAIAMRRILIERARRKRTARLSIDQYHQLEEPSGETDIESIDLLSLDHALDKLSSEPGRLTEVVHLRFFAGLSVEQTAAVMGVSPRTIKRDWNFARAWLRDEMSRYTDSQSAGDN